MWEHSRPWYRITPYPLFVPRSARCSSALCLSEFLSFQNEYRIKIIFMVRHKFTSWLSHNYYTKTCFSKYHNHNNLPRWKWHWPWCSVLQCLLSQRLFSEVSGELVGHWWGFTCFVTNNPYNVSRLWPLKKNAVKPRIEHRPNITSTTASRDPSRLS